ncbi:low-density lipoprotein receptor-related protein 1B-like [Mytilus californianus]|uniref:low-density lipoprotein receptor-related protein 1B-like n=1 Tax=Mytilus californianus TaxID=6549 RepID=UPI0022470A77|nr:low-density lipoprotein receptor-related protein 1B-like [Mytilus californianus]
MEVQVWLCLCFLLHCTIHATSYSGKLLYSTYSLIKEFDVDTRNVTILLELGSSHVFAIDYDYKNRFIYFPRYNTFYDIVRFAYPSKIITLQTIVKTSSYSSGIAVDSATDHIYWTEVHGLLSKCNLVGINVATVVSSLNNPWVIRLDITNRWMYIVEHYIGILKSTFDLSEKRTIVNFTSTPVYCMDIDTEENRLYWINHDGDMKSCKDDGSDVKTILSTNISRSYLAISVVGSNIYYANDNQLVMVTKTPGSTPTILYNDTNRIDSIFMFNLSGMYITIYNHVYVHNN